MTYRTPTADLGRAIQRERAAKEAAKAARRRRIAAVLTGCTAVMALPFAEAWVLMLVMSVVHASVVAAVPAVGYWTAVVLVVGLNLLTTYVQRMRKN
jgi:hypothetical protein